MNFFSAFVLACLSSFTILSVTALFIFIFATNSSIYDGFRKACFYPSAAVMAIIAMSTFLPPIPILLGGGAGHILFTLLVFLAKHE